MPNWPFPVGNALDVEGINFSTDNRIPCMLPTSSVQLKPIRGKLSLKHNFGSRRYFEVNGFALDHFNGFTI